MSGGAHGQGPVHDPAGGPRPRDLSDPALTREELAREGALLDGVDVVHSEPRFPVAGGTLERRAERLVALCFLVVFLAGVGFFAVFAFWPWEYDVGKGTEDLYTPLLGVLMGVALGGLGVGAVLYAKRLLPEEEAVQARHELTSPADDRRTTVALAATGFEGTGLARRKLLQRSLGLSLLGLGALAIAPLGGLIKRPGRQLTKTKWFKDAKLVRLDGSPVKIGDLAFGALETVFPELQKGEEGPIDAPQRAQDSVTMLIRLRPEQLTDTTGPTVDGHVAYSKICTHAGCPVSLYEQETGRLLCPCHQSQFQVTEGARPVFGPAARSLPRLAIYVDDEGYFRARGDYSQPIGPSFWERG